MTVLLQQVVPGGSGELNGIECGDCITHVDGVSVRELTMFTSIRGPIGSSVALRIQRGVPGTAEIIASSSELTTKSIVHTITEASSLEAKSSNTSIVSDESIEERIVVLERKPIMKTLVAAENTSQKIEEIKKED